MPRFYFDTCDDGGEMIRDDVGVEAADAQQAGDMAAKSLAEMANDVLPDGSHRQLTVAVRDESGAVVMTTQLTFEARETDPPR